MAKDKEKVSKEPKLSKKLSKGQVIILGLVGVVLIVVAIVVVRWLVLFQLYDGYKEDISSYTVAEAIDFQPISETTSSIPDQDMILALESDSLKLYLNENNGNIALYDKVSGAITYSNPKNVEEDEVASGLNKNYLQSQIVLDYFDVSRNSGKMDSFSFSAERNQITVKNLVDENNKVIGVRVSYVIGNLDSKTGIVPTYISKVTLDEVCEKIRSVYDDAHAKYISDRYASDEVVKSSYLKLSENAIKNATAMEKMNEYFEAVDFTQEDYLREMSSCDVDGALPISFTIPLEYRLDEENHALDASVPMSEVSEGGGGSVYRIQVLPYFGCAGVDEEGYILVPNGSGSLINFNNGKTTASAYSEYVYGIDPLAAEYTVVENSENVKMALFGMFRTNDENVVSGKTGFLATIEDGASYAVLNAGVAGKINSQNYVYSTFVMRGNDKLAMFGTTGNEAEIPIVETNHYDANITIKYTMLNDDDATCSGAANTYRNRLLKENGDLGAVLTANGDSTSTTSEDIKFYYDVLGGVTMVKHFLGTQYNGLYTMTTFSDAQEMSDTLAENGITNQVMNFQGWMNGGYHHNVVSGVSNENSIGNKADMEALNDTLEKNGGSLYADVAFQKVTTISKNYEESNETSRYYGSGYIVELGLVNPTTLRQTAGLGYDENRFYELSPKFLSRYVDSFTNAMKGYDVSGISVRDLGDDLHSDKKRTEVIDREAALDIVKASFETIAASGKYIMASDANDYAWAYVEDLVNVPTSANDYLIVDAEIPFYEMVIHGTIDYSGSLINLSDTVDDDELVLQLIENGASPHFVFTKKNSSEIKDTGMNRYYATTFDNWKDYAISIYSRVNEALKNVKNAFITDYEILNNSSGKKAVKVSYSNGIVIYVNYGDEDISVDGITVLARNYAMGGM